MAIALDPRKSAFWMTKDPGRTIVGGVVFLALAVAWLFVDSPFGTMLAILWGVYSLWRFASAVVTIIHRRRTGEVGDAAERAPLAQESDPSRRHQDLR